MKYLPLLIILLSFPLAYSENILLTHVGFGETPRLVIIGIYNNHSTEIENPSLYVDGRLYTNLEMRLMPNKSANYILYIEPGFHEIELRYKNESAKIIVVNNVVEINDAFTKSTNENLIKTSAIIILIVLSILLYFLIFKKPKLIK
jgi:hypothetical protein